jgi:branched-chain amino acid transport system permease protein
VYSLENVGFVLVLRTTGVFNFAQGGIMSLGPFVALDLMDQFHASSIGTLVVASAAMTAIFCVAGAALYKLLLVHLEGAPLWSAVMVLFGLSSIITGLIPIIWGAADLYITSPLQVRPISLPFGFITTQLDLATMGTSVVVIGLLLIFVYRTPVGLQMRASAEDRALASYGGIRVKRLSLIAWGLAAGLTAIAGLALALNSSVSASISDDFFVAFPAVMLGGIDSLTGAVIGSFILAIILDIGVTYINSSISTPLAFAVLLVILMVRPQGLVGTRDIVRI